MRLAAALALCALLLSASSAAAAPRALFDNTKAETAGNADWILDNDQPVPAPAQSGITWASAETYWTGAVSAWGVQLVKRGYTVATLTTGYGITYQNPANPYDLSNYDLFVVVEPNIRFSAAESTAIFGFVGDGGGLVAVSDHYLSDRNNDGYDSPMIWNLLDAQRRWGVHFAVNGEANNNVVQTSANVSTSPADSIIRGAAGVATAIAYHNGSTMTLDTVANPTVRGNVWLTGWPQGGASGAMVAQSVYGNGRIVFVGDSSPADDGTGTAGNTLYNGWAEAAGSDSVIFLNGSLWATRRSAPVDATPPAVTVLSPNGGESWEAGTTHAIEWSAADNVAVDSVRLEYSAHGAPGPWLEIAHGLANSGAFSWSVPAEISDSVVVRVTAVDQAGNAGADEGDALFAITPSLVAAGPGAAPVLALAAPAPNPGRGTTQLRFALPQAGRARLEIVDLAGRRAWAREAELAAGAHAWSWDGSRSGGGRARAGLYFVRLVTPWGTRVARLAWLG